MLLTPSSEASPIARGIDPLDYRLAGLPLWRLAAAKDQKRHRLAKVRVEAGFAPQISGHMDCTIRP